MKKLLLFLALTVSIYAVVHTKNYNPINDKHGVMTNNSIRLQILVDGKDIYKNDTESSFQYKLGDSLKISATATQKSYLISVGIMKDANGDDVQYLIENDDGNLETVISTNEKILFESISVSKPVGEDLVQFFAYSTSVISQLKDKVETTCIATIPNSTRDCVNYPNVFIENMGGKKITLNSDAVFAVTKGLINHRNEKLVPDEVRFYYLSVER